MRTIGFIGAFDKSDLIMYLGKIITVLRKKVLIIDATSKQKMRYIIPAINPTKSYITEYEQFDVAVGFDNFEDIKKYLAITEDNYLEYDYVLIDMDADWQFTGFNMADAYRNYFVTSFDTYSIKKGLETIEKMNRKIKMTKIIFSQDIIKEDDDYLDYLSSGYDLEWNKYKIRFPYEEGDHTAIMENQRLSKIKFKKLTMQYKEAMIELVGQIVEKTSDAEVRKACKIIEKE